MDIWSPRVFVAPNVKTGTPVCTSYGTRGGTEYLQSQKPDAAQAMSRESRVPVAPGRTGETRGDPVNAMRTVIQRLIPEGRSGIGSAARILGMSVRTLQRRLAETGVTYSDLVDEVRLASALALIDDRSIKLCEISRK